MREIEKFKIDKGYVVYKMRNIDAIQIFNGFGICDSCNKLTRYGYYIPILNWYKCEECFNEWKENCIYYPEDIWFEDRYVKFVDTFIKQSKEMKLIDTLKG